MSCLSGICILYLMEHHWDLWTLLTFNTTTWEVSSGMTQEQQSRGAGQNFQKIICKYLCHKKYLLLPKTFTVAIKMVVCSFICSVSFCQGFILFLRRSYTWKYNITKTAKVPAFIRLIVCLNIFFLKNHSKSFSRYS